MFSGGMVGYDSYPQGRRQMRGGQYLWIFLGCIALSYDKPGLVALIAGTCFSSALFMTQKANKG